MPIIIIGNYSTHIPIILPYIIVHNIRRLRLVFTQVFEVNFL